MKLTLNIEPGLIEQIKEVARRRNTSLSKVTETLFKKEVEIESQPFKIKTLEELPKWVQELSIATEPVPDFDHKAEYRKHIQDKYEI